jgi:hypothetical protein
LLVDGSGALRGIYDSDELGLDEAFWRHAAWSKRREGTDEAMPPPDVRVFC